MNDKIGKAPSTIKKHLRELRKLIDSTDDPILGRIAYEMETAVRWATEDVVGWDGLVEQAKRAAYILKRQLLNDQDS